jgi:hypothetical protein
MKKPGAKLLWLFFWALAIWFGMNYLVDKYIDNVQKQEKKTVVQAEPTKDILIGRPSRQD